MSSAPPKLEVIHGGSEAEVSAPTAELDSGNRNLLVWALGGLLAVALLGLGVQSRQAAELRVEVTALTAELATTQQALDAHEKHLDRVRSSIAELQELVDRDPSPVRPEPL